MITSVLEELDVPRMQSPEVSTRKMRETGYVRDLVLEYSSRDSLERHTIMLGRETAYALLEKLVHVVVDEPERDCILKLLWLNQR